MEWSGDPISVSPTASKENWVQPAIALGKLELTPNLCSKQKQENPKGAEEN